MSIEKLQDYKKLIQYDGSLQIATGRSRQEKVWKNKRTQWSAFLHKLEEPVSTRETFAEYTSMSKEKRDEIKDVGGFVGGNLKGGRRKADAVESRQMLTLDADFAPEGFIDDLILFLDYAYAAYSTHSHSPKKPRLRLLIPLDRPVTPDEYEAIARKIADEIGIDYFDDTTYQANRLMYFPSVSTDGEYLFTYEDLPWLKADDVLKRYPDWADASYWPESSRTKEVRIKLAKKQGDPTEKTGLIGAFCRTYTVEEAIEKFIPEVYAKCDMPGRYTYTEGSTAAGLVLYEDGKFAYSNHATDPAGGKLCNAFDLVRIHKFGIQDEEMVPETTVTKLPSYEAMMDLVKSDKETKLELARTKREEAELDFPDGDEAEWEGLLEYDKKGNILKSLNNVIYIMQYDPRVNGIVFNQMADNLEIKGDVPWKHPNKFWRDADDAQLEAFLADKHTEFSKAKIQTAITKAADDRSYHPIREYLDSIPEWDGVPRVDTLLIDYLGAEDTKYVRAVTRKTLCGAVVRIREPGCKFDTVLVLCGPQGIGKSTLVNNLGGEWFSDSLNLNDIKDKTAAEKLQGYWIVEMGELAGMGSAGVKTLRGFITTRDDRYRASYGRRVSSHPRQCIFIGTTNSEEGYLNDVDGGRRFWPVNVPSIGRKKVWDMTETDVKQIWAEALVMVNEGETLILDGDVANEALKQQKAAMISDPREFMVSEFLNKPLPADWYLKSKNDRRNYFDFDNETVNGCEKLIYRNRVCYQEIWCECFNYPEKTLGQKERLEIRKILERVEGWEQIEKRQDTKGYGGQTVYERIEKR
ncbi:MAG: virulence-associated E family protein [Clostridium sp.]